MLNEALYSSLVELGINEDKARTAATENQRIAEIHEYVIQLHRQAASMNDHICEVDRRLTRFEQHVDDRFDRVENDVKELKGMMQLLIKTLT